jgi:hypothetical protein
MPPPKDPIKYEIWREKQSKSHKGQVAHNKGIPCSEEQKEKIRKKLIGLKQSDETKQKRSESLKGRFTGKEWSRYGIKDSDKTRERKSKSNKGKHHTEERKNNISKGRKGILVKEETKKKISNNLKGRFMGEESNGWRGGVMPLHKVIRGLWQMKEWTQKVFERDNYTDVITGLKSNNLNAHHIKPFNDIIKENNITTIEEAINCEELWDINNGMTLDRDNHMKLFHSNENIYKFV